MTEITEMSASALARLIKERQASPVEVVAAQLSRIHDVNPRLNAIVTLCEEGALAQAKQAEKDLTSGRELGLLHGVPVTVKDNYDTAGIRTTAGSKVAADHVPVEDALAVARMREAGAIVMGKTNMPELGFSYDCDNLLFGSTHNPWAEDRTPGGSSGGEGAAIAARMSPLGLGNDLGGSIRVPAHFCGIFGLKPTPGRVPRVGSFPQTSVGAIRMMAVNGPLARSVDDLELAFRVLAGPDPRDPITVPVSWEGSRSVDVSSLTIAAFQGGERMPVSQEIREAVVRAAMALREAGLEVREEEPPDLSMVVPTFAVLILTEGLMHVESLIQDRWDEVHLDLLDLREMAEARPAGVEQFVEALSTRLVLMSKVQQWMEERPIVLAPIYATPAFIIGQRMLDIDGESVPMLNAARVSSWVNLLGLPAVAVPTGLTSGGLPVGVQVVARPFRESEALAVARVLEQAFGGSPRPPL